LTTSAITVSADASQVVTTVSNDVGGGGARDCLTVAAMVFKTEVQDTDGDGLLDVWETAMGTTSAPALVDPNLKPLPALGAMGANPYRKDVFLEIGYMNVAAQIDTNSDTVPDSISYGGQLRPPHSHQPGHEALKLVGDAFKSAPVSNTYGSHVDTSGIAIHFDVGTSYPACVSGSPCADEYIIGRRAGESSTLARGGEAIDEMVTVCDPLADEASPPEWKCQFSTHPGTVGWKSGFRFLRDQVTKVNTVEVSAFNEDLCGTIVGGIMQNCERRFDSDRMQMFRYALFAHALGLPKSELPCLTVALPVTAVAADAFDHCPSDTTKNPDFHTPRTNTGVGDFPGADKLITLGAFLDYDGVTPTGTPFMQAATLMHEMGHTFGRRHGGEAFEPNCKPLYFSVMNYTYQLRGLVPLSGFPQINFSGDSQSGRELNEASLSDGSSGVSSTYRMAWYAPIAGPLALQPGVKAAKRHCDGSDITDGAQYVRIDSLNHTNIDWNGDGIIASPAPGQDLNFSGSTADVLRGSNDWGTLGLNQIGSRRNVGGLFVDPVTGALLVGPLSGDVGKGDLGKGDLGKGDLGKGDLGKGDLGKGDLGKGDLGKGDLGKGDLGKGDLGGGDLFGDEGEVDETLATELTRVPPNAVAACQLGVGCAGAPQNYVQVSGIAPTVGGVKRYTVYRALRDADGNNGPWTKLLTPGQLGTVELPVPGHDNRTFDWKDPDSHKLVQGRTYAYQVTATYSVKNSVTGLFEDLESNGSSPDATVEITNAPPTIAHSIGAQSIFTNDSTGALPFTVGDTETLASIAATPNVLTATAAVTGSTNAALTDEISFNLATISPTSRTVQVVHAGTNTGTVTITLTVKDTQCQHANPPVPCTPGTTNSSTFTVTVNPRVYNLFGIQNVPTATIKSVKAGSTLPMVWEYRSGPTSPAVDSLLVKQKVTVTGPVAATYSCTTATTTSSCTDSGSSFFRYDPLTKRWSLNLQTKQPNGTNYPTGTYTVQIVSETAGFIGSEPFPVKVVK
jgi:hypothetical protein